jgi:hypothetical protein
MPEVCAITMWKRIPARTPMALGALLLVPFGCGGGSSPEEKVATTKAALDGSFTFDMTTCTDQEASMLGSGVGIARTLVLTPEFQACVTGQYRACSLDNDKNVNDLITATQSPNSTLVHCLPGAFNGNTPSADMHDWGYTGTEEFDINTTLIDSFGPTWSTYQSNNSFGQPTFLASVMWHEALHVHGYSHGDNSDATKAANACGYGSDPTWFWRANSANYSVEKCLMAAYTNWGTFTLAENQTTTYPTIVPSALRPPPPPSPPNCNYGKEGCSLVDLYMLQANRYPITARRDAIYNFLENGGTLSLADLKRAVKGNSVVNPLILSLLSTCSRCTARRRTTTSS